MTVLLVLGVATAWWSFAPSGASSIVPVKHRLPTQASSLQQSATSEVDAAAPMEDEAEVDPFAPHGWQAPPPVQEAPKVVMEAAPPQAPAAPSGPPPLPYKFMGRMNDGGDGSQQMVYLSKGDQISVVQGGETLDGSYKVLHVESDHIEFEYLPTGEQQVLSIAANDK